MSSTNQRTFLSILAKMVKIIQEQSKTEKVVVAVECDKCHKVYRKEETEVRKGLTYVIKTNDMWELPEMHHIDFAGGYGSVFGDGNRVQCDLCQHCLMELITPFARVEDRYKSADVYSEK